MRIEVTACNGGMGAQLLVHDFTPEDLKSQFGDVESLHRLLSRSGIAREFFDNPGLQLVHNLLGQSRIDHPAETIEEAQSIIVATGVPPTDDEFIGLRITKSYLMEEDALTDLKFRLTHEPFEVTEKSLDPKGLVEIGETILDFTVVRKGNAGVGVFGEAIPTGPANSPLPKPGSSILEESNKWVALRRGVLVVEDNTFKILGPQSSKQDCLLVSADKMSVRVLIRNGEEEDFKPTKALLERNIIDRHFEPAPSLEKAWAALDAFEKTGKNQDRLILSGTPSTPGTDGRLELLIDPEPILPEPDKDGNIDFKSFSFFRTVRRGESLARIIPPSPGIAGMDVFGQPILPKDVTSFNRALGKNTELTRFEPIQIIAGRDGRLLLSDGIPEVADTLQINDDVSLKTGNIVFPGSVEVLGDVRDNLEIKAKGDVEISGVVEDGSIVSEGAIVVKGGFTGSGKGVIKSKLSSVSIGFIRNQRIESHSDIIVYSEVVNAQLFAMKSINMKSMGNSVVGGHLLAYSSIEICNAGSRNGAKTILEVGKDFEVEMELVRKKAGLKKVQEDLAFLEKMSEKFKHLIRWSSAVKGDVRLLEQRTRGVAQLLKALRETLTAQVRALEARLYNPGYCFIRVKGEAFPGTVLRYQDRNLILKAPSHGKRWVFRGDSGAVPSPEMEISGFA